MDGPLFEWSWWSIGFWSLIAYAVLTAPFSWYANQAGYEATEDGREKKMLGQVTAFAEYNEVKRLAERGERFARATLFVLRVSMVVPVVAWIAVMAMVILGGRN